ncbi:MAG: glycosyltransferase family 1 protein [bacterium]|nr:glycosyltransferase family 1 protein [bacterium]
MKQLSNMHIGIDARFFGTGGKGLGRYTEKLVKNLEKLDGFNRYTIFLRPENYDEYRPANPRFQKVLAPYRWYSLAEQLFFPRLMRNAQVDLMHFLHFNVPYLYRGPFIVTIHDLIITNYPTRKATTLGPIKYWFKRTGYRFVISSAVKRAKKVISVSEYTKRELCQFFGLHPDRVGVTYEAADMFPESTRQDNEVLSNYGLKKPYLLYVGNAYPHKNLELLLDAIEELVKTTSDLKLVMVGKNDYFFDRLKELSVRRKLAGLVEFTGYVPDDHLPALYRQAVIYVFPSLAEGFGLPPLEAMQYGTPVASSSVSSLPEVLGDAAAYFDPKNKRAIVMVLSDLLQHSEKRVLLQERGFHQVSKYSWERMAKETIEYYKTAT